jgi:hypothetical protein
MNNTLHTPGPWKCDLVSLKIWANDGNTEIARTSSDVSISEEEANARLIASAPDLLSALESAYNAIAWDIPGGNLSDKEEETLLDVIREALRKAKGEA